MMATIFSVDDQPTNRNVLSTILGLSVHGLWEGLDKTCSEPPALKLAAHPVYV